MKAAGLDPPRNGEGDRDAKRRGGGGNPPTQRPVVYQARKLRKNMTTPEVALWRYLRGKPSGVKFRRQYPIGPYIVDFCCLSARLAIEIDGISHEMGGHPSVDQRRTEFIEQHGFRVIRIAAQRVLADVEGTAMAIVSLAALPLHRPAYGPPPHAGED